MLINKGSLRICHEIMYEKKYFFFLRNSPSWSEGYSRVAECLPNTWSSPRLVLGGRPPFFLEKKSPLELDEGHSLAELAKANHLERTTVTVQLAMMH